MSTYTAADVEVSGGLEPVRRRPAMYIGSTQDGSGLLHMLWGALGHGLDQFQEGQCQSIAVTLHEGGAVSVADDGCGLPVEAVGGATSELERSLTTLSQGRFLGPDAPRVPLSYCLGAWPAVLNALSDPLVVDVWRLGKHYRQVYRRGRPEGPLEVVGGAERQGTRIAFTPDPTIFTEAELDASVVAERLRELAFLCPGVAITFADERALRFRYARGVADYVARVNRGRGARHEVIACRGGQGPLAVEAALQWTHRYDERVFGFVNAERTADGGTHVDGLTRALVGMFVEQTRTAAPATPGRRRRIARAMSRGLTAVVSVNHHDPRFDGGSTRSRLSNPEVAGAVAEIVAVELRRFCAEQPEQAAEVVERARQALR